MIACWFLTQPFIYVDVLIVSPLEWMWKYSSKDCFLFGRHGNWEKRTKNNLNVKGCLVWPPPGSGFQQSCEWRGWGGRVKALTRLAASPHECVSGGWLCRLDDYPFFANFQPLMECYVNLREKGTAINIHLTETWWRHYQVSLSDYENYLSSVPP